MPLPRSVADEEPRRFNQAPDEAEPPMGPAESLAPAAGDVGDPHRMLGDVGDLTTRRPDHVFTGAGRGSPQDPILVRLSELIESFISRFSVDISHADALMLFIGLPALQSSLWR